MVETGFIMPSLFNNAFREWTDGLDPDQARVSIFEHIRDIPYSLTSQPGLRNPEEAPETLLSLGRGSCVPKHHLLSAMYRKLGLEIVYATFAFSWNDPAIAYPPRLRELAARLPVSYHLATRVRIRNRWVLVDATWDSPLARAGFPVNEHWDGFADTKCAVKPLKSAVRTAYCRTVTNEPYRDSGAPACNPRDGEQNHGDAEDRDRYYREKISLRTPDERNRILNFYQELDAWMETIRQSGV
jgi:hypothetical protein